MFLVLKLHKNTRIASYLSFAANACGAAVNSGALCAGDWTALMANFGEMATVGAAVKEDCNFDTATWNQQVELEKMSFFFQVSDLFGKESW